jgi:hypothetical protein
MSTSKKVTTRNWSYDKFASAVLRRAKKAGVPAKAVKAGVMKKGYESGLSVAAAAAAFKTNKAA